MSSRTVCVLGALAASLAALAAVVAPVEIYLALAGLLLVGLFKRKGVRFFNPPHHPSDPNVRSMTDFE